MNSTSQSVSFTGRSRPRLAYFPVSFFGMVMGLFGTTIAWQKAEALFPELSLGQFNVSDGLAIIARLLFALTLLAYGYKWMFHADLARKEAQHPIMLNFVPTVSISLLLLAACGHSIAPEPTRIIWMAGAALQLALTLYVLNNWIQRQDIELVHMSPAWFIPIVGNLIVPVAGVPFRFIEISWLFFAIGLMFWIVLFAIVLYRIIFHHPLPEKLLPTLAILIAPPAVAMLDWVLLNGGTLDSVARVLYYLGLFIGLVLITQAKRLTKIPFSLSWWAWSFPIAALTIATLTMANHIPNGFFMNLSLVLLALLSLIVLGLLKRTFSAARQGAICQPE
ncbi:MAG: SLAC1 anion channel family protein [Gammaproteobacteria bacterium]